MKSNEEFIAGIYEKAALYTEEKESRTAGKLYGGWKVAKMTKIAAMVAVCIGLAGVGSMVLGNGKSAVPGEMSAPNNENYGIALTSEVGEEFVGAADGVAQFRIGPVAETVTFTGIVENIDEKENRIWIKLLFEESAPEYTEGSVVCIRWDMLEPISEQIVVGTKLTATGALSRYENEISKQDGCAELILTDLANLEVK